MARGLEVDFNDPCVFCSVCHYMNTDGDKSNCPKYNKKKSL